MNEKVKAFYEAISADEDLQAELIAVSGGVNTEGVSEEEARRAMAEAAAAFAAAHDFDLTAADILEADAEVAEAELSETELETVAGGLKGFGPCGCVILGMLKGCGCFVVGTSSTTDTNAKCHFVYGATGDEYL